jgi:hypothetical protein
MKGKMWLVLLASLALVLLPSSIEVTRNSFVDLESSSGNTFQAWASTQWVQTTQADFEAGVLDQVDISSSPGDVKLAETSDWYDSNWSYRREITIDHTLVADVTDPSTTYADFPVLVYATGLSDILANGADIRFTASDGVTELPREIESYSDGTLYAWVQVTLTKDASDASDDVIYMYYGNGSASEPAPDSTYGSENVWDANFKAVYHLNETVDDEGSGATHYDSTLHDNDGTQDGNDDATGKIASGQAFDATDDYINVPDASSLRLGTGNFTVAVWVEFPISGSYYWEGIVVKGFATSAPANMWGLVRWSNYTYGVQYWDAGDTAGEYNADLNSGEISDGWHYVVVTRDGSLHKMYVDSTECDSDTTTPSNLISSDPLKLGSDMSPRWFGGTIDEVRISNILRPETWLTTEYNNQSNPSAFCGVGMEETAESSYSSPGTIASQVLDTEASGAVWNCLFWDETLQSSTDITFEVRTSDTSFAKDADTPTWNDVGGSSPVNSGLPSGRYMQWRATLMASDTSKTPTLHEVRVYYY